MTQQTETAVAAILAADCTVTPERRDAALAALRGDAPEPQGAPLGRVLTAQEVAELFGVTRRAVNQWRTKGLIRPVAVGTARRFRYAEGEVRRILAGDALPTPQAAPQAPTKPAKADAKPRMGRRAGRRIA